MRALQAVSALIALLIAVVPRSRAQAQADAWLVVRSACSAATVADQLMARLNDATVGARAADLRAHIEVARRDRRYHVVLRVERGADVVGEKELVASSCEEAEDAAVAVLALALSDLSADPREAEAEPVIGPVVIASLAHDAESVSTTAAVAPSSSREPSVDARTLSARELWRDGVVDPSAPKLALSLRAGVDAGTLPTRTAYVGAALSRFFGPLGLRALMGVGLPYAEVQQNDAGFSEYLRGDFAMLEVGLCYALGARLTFAACASSDVSVVRRERTLRVQNESDRVARRTEPLLSGVLTAIAGYRMGAIQPELELSAVMVALGEPQGASRLALRAGAGVGMHF